jgi:plastocyanin
LARCPAVRLAAIALSVAAVSLLPRPQALAAQGDYRVVPVDDGAALGGRVTFSGEVPAPKRLLVTKDEEICGFGYQERFDVSVAPGGGLAGVVVVVEGVTEGKEWPDAAAGHVVDQRDCIFQPNLQVIPKWTEMSIVNSDPVLHNIHAWELMDEGGRTLFNLGQPPEREVIIQALRPRRGSRIRLECDAHDFMQGWIYAADSPYAVATNEDGSFRIDGIPPGEYTITAWHPFLGVREQVVELELGGEGEVAFDFTGSQVP